jgi:putative toxin-antitoxin system antitoxin component (TIGR02293 family)
MPGESEKTDHLARVAALAQDVWDDAADAHRFLTTPHPMLGGNTPAAHCATAPGAREVERILHSIALGLPV